MSTPEEAKPKFKMPDWLPEALATAQVADKLALSMDEAAWLRERAKSKKGPIHWKVIYLYFKSNFKLWRREASK